MKLRQKKRENINISNVGSTSSASTLRSRAQFLSPRHQFKRGMTTEIEMFEGLNIGDHDHDHNQTNETAVESGTAPISKGEDGDTHGASDDTDNDSDKDFEELQRIATNVDIKPAVKDD